MILDNFNQWLVSEYTLPRDDRASQPKGWTQGNMRIGPVLEVTTNFQHFKYGIEIRIKSVNQDDSHSWVRISYGTVKYVIDSIEDNTKNPADSQEEQSPTNKYECSCSQVKGKSKTSTENTRWDNSNHTNDMKEDGLTLSHQNKILPRTIFRRKSLIFFDTIRRFSEKKMDQLNCAK